MDNFNLTKYLAEGKLFEEDFKNPILDKYLELKKSIDYKTVFPTDLQSFLDSLDNTEREGLKRDLAEGKLLKEVMSPQDVVDIADTVAEEFTIESAEEGDFMVYSVGEMDVDNMFFELDTDVTSQTPERILKMSNLGVGEGWGGSFRINPKEEGYEVRNSEKGGLVAIIDGMGNFKMLSADESRAEMGRAKGEETDYMQSRKETDDYMQEGEDKVEETKPNKMKKSELKEMIKAAMMAEMEVEETTVFEAEDEDIEDEIEVDDVDVDVDVDMDMSSDAEGIDVKQDADTDLGGTVGDVQDNLEAALAAARQLGDEKLEDQIGNTLTFFTRTHVVKEDMLEDEAELGLEEDDDNQTFPEEYFKKLPPLPDQRKWDEMLAYMAHMATTSYGDKKTIIDTIAGIADGSTKTGAYSAWKNSKTTSESLNESTFPMWDKMK